MYLKGGNYEDMLEAVRKVAHQTSKKKVTLQSQIEVENGNLAIAMSKDSTAFFDHLTAALTSQTHPTAAMKQTLDDIKAQKADLTEMYDGGAWRDFNIPANNNPHVTFAYDIKVTNTLQQKLNKTLSVKVYAFKADKLVVAKIDENGNIYGKPLLSVKLD